MQPFQELQAQAIADLAAGWCVSIYGLSNTGKSTLMRALASPDAAAAYRDANGQPAYMVYVDCNRAVALTAQGFYEVVLRSLLEHLADQEDGERIHPLHDYYQSVTEDAAGFSASLAFNLALTTVCERFERHLCLLFDEFDELYAALDDRALLNLRALRDRFRDRLRYATATARRLPKLREAPVEGEFAELFSHSVFPMQALGAEESQALLSKLELPSLDMDGQAACHALAGGHPGLLVAIARAISRWDDSQRSKVNELILLEPGPRAECLKLWSQLLPEEQEAYKTLVAEAGMSLPPQRLQPLVELGLVKGGQPFSPIFANFVARMVRATHAGAKGVQLDTDSGDVWVEGVRIPVLTDLEFRLISLLYERRDKLTDKLRIVQGVWGDDYLAEVDDARVEKLVSRLRSKIERDPANPRYLITQRGRGYKLLSRPARRRE